MTIIVYVVSSPDSQPWYVLEWWDWVGVASAVLGIIGLSIAIWQSSEAKNAAQAALEAVKDTQSRIRANQIMVLAPQLRSAFRDVELSVMENDATATHRSLDRWRSQAAYLSGLLTAEHPHGNETIGAITFGIAQAVVANEALMKASSLEGKALIKARTAMGTACDSIDVWVGGNLTKDVSSRIVPLKSGDAAPNPLRTDQENIDE